MPKYGWLIYCNRAARKWEKEASEGAITFVVCAEDSSQPVAFHTNVVKAEPSKVFKPRPVVNGKLVEHDKLTTYPFEQLQEFVHVVDWKPEWGEGVWGDEAPKGMSGTRPMPSVLARAPPGVTGAQNTSNNNGPVSPRKTAGPPSRNLPPAPGGAGSPSRGLPSAPNGQQSSDGPPQRGLPSAPGVQQAGGPPNRGTPPGNTGGGAPPVRQPSIPPGRLPPSAPQGASAPPARPTPSAPPKKLDLADKSKSSEKVTDSKSPRSPRSPRSKDLERTKSSSSKHGDKSKSSKSHKDEAASPRKHRHKHRHHKHDEDEGDDPTPRTKARRINVDLKKKDVSPQTTTNLADATVEELVLTAEVIDFLREQYVPPNPYKRWSIKFASSGPVELESREQNAIALLEGDVKSLQSSVAKLPSPNVKLTASPFTEEGVRQYYGLESSSSMGITAPYISMQGVREEEGDVDEEESEPLIWTDGTIGLTKSYWYQLLGRVDDGELSAKAEEFFESLGRSARETIDYGGDRQKAAQAAIDAMDRLNAFDPRLKTRLSEQAASAKNPSGSESHRKAKRAESTRHVHRSKSKK